MIDLEQAVHFFIPNGEPVVVAPGEYEVEAADQGLRFRPREGDDQEPPVNTRPMRC